MVWCFDDPYLIDRRKRRGLEREKWRQSSAIRANQRRRRYTADQTQRFYA
jgi:hypothetical protein